MKQAPLAFCLMSRHRKIDYKKVLRQILLKLGDVQVEVMVADFEQVIWLAMREVLPDVVVRGCSFHWAQAVNRKIGELGLQYAYRNNTSVHNFIRCVMALPFLPADHIQPAFRCIKGKTTSDDLHSLLSYIDNTWMKSSVWTVESWSTFLQPIRTNNDVEGWHRRLHVKAQDNKPPMYVLVQMLEKEARLIPIQARMVAEGKQARKHRSATKTMQGKIFALWDSYREDRISVSDFLKDCGRTYS